MFDAATLRAHLRPARPLHAALAARLGRADDERHRRPRVAARADARGARGRARGGHARAPRRRAADERGGGDRGARGRLGGGCSTPPGWTSRRASGAPIGAVLAGLPRADRRGVALQADVGRLDAPGGDRRRGRRCTRSTTTSTGWPTTTPTRAPWPRGSPRCPGSRSTRPRSRPTSSCSAAATPRGCATSSSARAWRWAPIGPGQVRAVTHLDVDRAGIDTALEAVRAAAHRF